MSSTEVSRGAAWRSASRNARWVGFALGALMIAPSIVRATLVCNGDPEFVRQCEAAIEDIRTATPVGAATVERLNDPNGHMHVITQTPEPFGGNYPVDRNAANDLESDGLGLGSDTLTRWNPDATSPYPDSGVARDPIAALQHELWHANVADTGGRSEAAAPGTNIGQREIDATIVENEYRLAKGLCPRPNYGEAAVPQPSPSPGASPSASPSPTPAPSPCP